MSADKAIEILERVATATAAHIKFECWLQALAAKDQLEALLANLGTRIKEAEETVAATEDAVALARAQLQLKHLFMLHKYRVKCWAQ